MAHAPATRFHGYLDAVVRPYQVYKPAPGWTNTAIEKHFVIQDRTLSYRFYPHSHPYVGELVRRLIEGSVRGLQATDTEYVENTDGTLETLPDSTQVALLANTTVAPQGGTPRTIPRGLRITLPDGTAVTLPGGGQAALPGKMIVTQPRGMRVTAGGTPQAILFGAQITLANNTPVTLPNGEPVTLPGGTQLVILSCKPKPKLFAGIFSSSSYNPSELVQLPYPANDLDFTPSAAYGVYNWELFYHVPFMIAVNLSKNQRFEEAMRWFHYMFDPTDDSGGPTPERFWKVKPFQYTDVKLIEEILVNLSTGADPTLRQETINSIGAWKDSPFRPHVVARYRQTAYMFKTVMAYLDNLIDWGDSLFRQDTIESINEATQLYVLAANILGPRPQAVPKKGSIQPQTYANLKKQLDELGNALVEVEPDIPFDLLPHPGEATPNDQLATLNSIGKSLYFCVPRNDKLVSYWDTVADRLFKIHNSLNIQGIFRQLPLFEPPIDPALLAKAAAAGLDLGAIVSGLNQPLPLVRFQFLVQRAAEICQEVKSLGNSLLSAIEKEDNEALASLRAKHELVILGLAEAVKYSQLQESIKAREGLEKSLLNAAQRYLYYERLLGEKEEDIKKKIPELDALNTAGLDKLNFQAGEPAVQPRDVPIEIFEELAGEGGGRKLNPKEAEELSKLKDARSKQEEAGTYDKIGAFLGAIPTFSARLQPFGPGGAISFGGSNLAAVMSGVSSLYKSEADARTYEASKAAKIGSYTRREQEWAFQSALAAGEITQIFKQLRAAQIREYTAKREWDNHKQQIAHAEDIEHFLKGEKNTSGHKKTTIQAFYAWMKRDVRGLYGQVFQFAFDISRKAERALQHELGNPDVSFLQFGYLAGKEGLLAGERLYLDIKRMEMAYHDLNRREYELTKHVSLLQADPLALLQLRTTGRATLALPEALFDMDGPGHYFRRIKTVAVSIPCVAGPYASVNCRLTLLKSSIRKTPVVGDQYARVDAEDGRFSNYFGSLESIVTSSAQTDSGLFETNLRDERYLPFENSGAISEWQLELPANPSKKDPAQFDYDTIADVILHIRYTAREGGDLLRSGATGHIKELIAAAQAAGSVRLFSVRHEFPTEWARFQSQAAVAGQRFELTLEFRPEHYPFWSQGRLGTVVRLEALARSSQVTVPASLDLFENASTSDKTKKGTLTKDPAFGNLLRGQLTAGLPPKPDGQLKLFWETRAMTDIWLALTWSE
jgi:hypothetical protein